MREFLTLARKHFWFVLLFFAGLIGLLLWFIQTQDVSDSAFWAATGALLSALLTGTLIAVAEKVGWLSNYRAEMQQLEQKIEELPFALNERLFFGFDRIIPNFEEPNFLVDHENGEVCWLNTYFRFWDEKPEIIFSVIKRRNKVRLLFMHPDSPELLERAYYAYSSDIGPDTVDANEVARRSFDDHVDAYRSSLTTNMKKCRTLMNDFRSRFPDLDETFLQVRFYVDSPQLPLIALRSLKNSTNTNGVYEYEPVRAASGFYLDQYSSQMPYITWRRTDETGQILVHNISNYFDKKWNHEKTVRLENLEVAE